MKPMNIFAARSLAQAFTDGARDHPDAELVVASRTRAGRHRLAWLFERSCRLSAGLSERGIGTGDVVAVQLSGSAEWIITAAAVAHVGAVLLPIVPIYGAHELAFILGQSRAKAIVTPDHWRGKDSIAAVVAARAGLPHLRYHIVMGDMPADTNADLTGWTDLLGTAPDDTHPSAPGNPDALAMLIYTSGTTSAPKGVCHSARTLLSEVHSVATPWDQSVPACFLSPWQPGHIAGISPILAYLVTGRKLVLMDDWNAVDAARLIEKEGVTVTSFTPAHIAGLMDAVDQTGADISTLRECSLGAAPVSPSLVSRCERAGMRVFRRYGATEHPSITAGDPGDPLDKRLATEGRCMPGNQIRLVDDLGRDVKTGDQGEIASRGPERFLGYLDPALDTDAFLPGGWYRTGDIGRIDDDGYLILTDRKKDVIIRGGENISSREVEDILAAHPAIAEAAAVARPDHRMGERVCAFVVPRDSRPVTLDSIRDHFASRGVARQKTPEHLRLTDTLPRNATGKVLKHLLRERLAAEVPAE